MLGMVALVSGGFTFLIWNSYRTARLRWEIARGFVDRLRERDDPSLDMADAQASAPAESGDRDSSPQ